MGLELDGVNGIIKNTTSDGAITIKGNDGGNEISALTFDMSDAGAATFNGTAIMDGNSWHKTNKIAYFGDGLNLQISSDGTNANIAESGGSGNLVLSGQTIRLAKSDGEIMLEATNDAGVDIRHNHVTKLETTSTGIDVTGTVTSDGASLDGAVVINEASAEVDFRVESNNNANCLIVKGANDRVGIGGADASFGVLGVENAGDSHIDMFSNVGSGTIGKCEIFFSTDSSADHVSIASIVAQQPTGDQASRKGEFRFNVSDNGGPAVAMLIGNNGNVGIGTDGPQARLDCQTSAASTPALEAHATSSSYATEVVKFACQRNTTNGSYKFIACNVPGVGDRFDVLDSGTARNATNTYTSNSDERLKSNIKDANSQWEDIKAVKVRNFTKYDMPDLAQIGVVSQELEASGMNGLVMEVNPSKYDIGHNSAFGTLYTSDDAETKDGNDKVLYVAEDAEVIDGAYNVGDIKEHATHSKKVGDVKEVKDQVKVVKYSILYMKAIKALQEAQTRIETLETKVAALEG